MRTAVGSASSLTRTSGASVCRVLKAVGLSVVLCSYGGASELPVWRGDESRIALPGQRAFISEDGSTLIALVIEGETQKVVSIPLRNRIYPEADLDVSRASTSRETLVYAYKIRNDMGAGDAIGMWSIVAPVDTQLEVVHRLDGPGMKWSAWAANAPVAKQARLPPDTPNGRFVTWLRHEHGQSESPVINPGEAMDGFEIRSNLTPGFTTAYFYHGEYISLDPDWPRDLQFQLKDFWEDTARRQPTLLVLGPMFDSTASLKSIAENFAFGVSSLVADGRLPVSSHVIETVTDFQSSLDVPLKWPDTKPGLEADILTSLRLALEGVR